MQSPNIVFIMADDLGWRDLGYYGSPFYETPRIDRLARSGMRFTDAYAACPVCSPTRASVLTGKNPATVGVTNFIPWNPGAHPARGRLIDAPYIDHLPLEEDNLARRLKRAGYQTWHAGKWHLGPADHYPDRQGFDVNLGGAECGRPIGGYFSPWKVPGLDPAPEQHVDGTSFAPALRGEAFARGPIFWHYPHYGNQGGTPACAIREGDEKLIELFEDDRLELYDLRADVSEERDLSAERPERARALHEKLVAWREEKGAKLPAPNPGYVPPGDPVGRPV